MLHDANFIVLGGDVEALVESKTADGILENHL